MRKAFVTTLFSMLALVLAITLIPMQSQGAKKGSSHTSSAAVLTCPTFFTDATIALLAATTTVAGPTILQCSPTGSDKSMDRVPTSQRADHYNVDLDVGNGSEICHFTNVLIGSDPVTCRDSTFTVR